MASGWARPLASGWTLDVVVVAVTLAIAASEMVQGRPHEPTPLRLGVSLLCCVAIFWRRRQPELVLGIAVLGLVLAQQPGPIILAVGTVAEVHGASRRTWIVLALVSVPTLVELATRIGPLATVLAWGALVAFPTAVGITVAGNRATAASLAEERARRAADVARRDERTRIAREMHDVVAHQVSLIALQAGALEVSADNPQTVESAQMIRRTARQALEELRTVVGLLRTTESAHEERAPRTTLAEVRALVDEWREAGMDVTLQDRTPPGFLDACPPRVARTSYRVVREALTNVSKHAAGATATVELSEDEGRLCLVVRNGVSTRTSSRAATGAGVGLYGMRERVALLGGTFHAGSEPDGGYCVRALLPMIGDLI
ncbi:sensor histidine kinase [Nocardioides sp. zg-ZUI104]|uniref:sensor histidine kinase n=1 Tax=Nocardioides faecalis TaxID=2803858 RepID=UPI001BD144BA|nr:sensor histidine kinase [Nocardioides faecalis]MBS4753259.1 sensor histidine kinase [Nocardioides faecalis]